MLLNNRENRYPSETDKLQFMFSNFFFLLNELLIMACVKNQTLLMINGEKHSERLIVKECVKDS